MHENLRNINRVNRGIKKPALKVKLNTVYFLIYGALACYFPFLTIFFKQKGLTISQIGMAYALSSLISVIFQPIWGYVTDKFLNKKTTILITIVCSALIILLYLFANGFYVILMMVSFFIIFQCAICPVTDAYCYEIIEETKELQYGRVRLMGSLGYGVTALLLSEFIKSTSLNSAFYVYPIMMIVGALIILTINFKGKGNTVRLNINDFQELFKNKKFMYFIFSVMLINIPQGANGSYISILINETGGGITQIGLMWFIVALSELPALYFGNKLLKKSGELNLYCIASILFFVRFFLGSICTNYMAVILVQLMESVTFPLYLIASIEYTNKLVSPRMRTSGMTLYSAIGIGLGAFIGNIGGGLILEVVTVFWLYKIMAFICLGALFTGITLKKM